MIATTIAALLLQARANFAFGGNVALGISATALLALAAAVVAVAVSRLAKAVSAPTPEPMVSRS